MGTTVRTSATALPTSTIQSTYTNPLRTYFSAGNAIAASHFTLLKDFINAVTAHTHTLQEYGRIADFGNTGSTNGPYTQTTTTPNGRTSLSTTFTSGTTVTASQHNALRNEASAYLSHAHNFEDTVN